MPEGHSRPPSKLCVRFAFLNQTQRSTGEHRPRRRNDARRKLTIQTANRHNTNEHAVIAVRWIPLSTLGFPTFEKFCTFRDPFPNGLRVCPGQRSLCFCRYPKINSGNDVPWELEIRLLFKPASIFGHIFHSVTRSDAKVTSETESPRDNAKVSPCSDFIGWCSIRAIV